MPVTRIAVPASGGCAVDAASVDAASVDAASVDAASVDAASVDAASVDDVPAGDASAASSVVTSLAAEAGSVTSTSRSPRRRTASPPRLRHAPAATSLLATSPRHVPTSS